ncbi:MAG: hypothetical protein NDJ89_13605 [Oligoflexia bacterium]|nr:hypothetical protein [Oligoflexia bacterium]
MKPKHGLVFLMSSLICAALALNACGKPSELAQARRDGMIPVTGSVDLGTQCPFGTISPKTPTRLQLWDCPIGLERLTLAQPLDSLYLSVDCKKKILTIRKENRKLDTAWEFLPDGSFEINIDGGVARLAADGPDRAGCSSPVRAVMMGSLDCSDPDRAKIQLETVWYLGQSENPERDRELFARESKCELPSGCYLYSSAALQQCE